MIDTIRVKIEGLPAKAIDSIKYRLQSKLTIDNDTGEIRSEFTTGTLLGSYDSRISVRIKDVEYIPASTVVSNDIHKLHTKELRTRKELHYLISENIQTPPVAVTCDPYLEIEFSLAKWADGVNFFNTPLIDDIRNLIRFRLWLQEQFDCKLPDLYRWRLLRLDCAVNYDFGTLENIRHYITLWRGLDYPRRKKPTFYADSLYIPGSVTTLKMYAKQPEFKKHDFGRIKKYITGQAGILDQDKKRSIKEKMKAIMESIAGVFRFEVEFHKRKLDELGATTIVKLFDIDWAGLMEKEMEKLIGEAPSGKVHTLSDVTQKLTLANNNGYLKGKGASMSTIIAVYTSIVVNGRKTADEVFGRQKVYRVRKILKALKINYVSTLTENKPLDQKTKECNIKDFRQYSNYAQMRTFRKSTSWNHYSGRRTRLAVNM